MKNRSMFPIITLIFVIAAMMLNGCAGTSRPSSFYLMSSLPDSGQSLKAAGDTVPSILVGPITLPAYLDRDQVVTVAGSHEMLVDEYTRWAEPLEDNLYRVLVEDLSVLTGSSSVFAYDRRGNKATDFRVVIDVTRFDCSVEGQAHLTAFWTISKAKEKMDLIQRKSVIRIAGSPADSKGKIDAQNQVLNRFSREIAAAIESLQR